MIGTDLFREQLLLAHNQSNLIHMQTLNSIILILAISILLSCNSGPSEISQQENVKDVESFTDDLYGGTGGLSVDKEGNVYSSDFGPFLGQLAQNFTPKSKIFKITPDGKVSIFADSLTGASGSEFDSNGNLYQSNIRGRYISKITPLGEMTIFSMDSLVAPVGIAIDKNDDLVVCNCGNNTLRKITKDGSNTLFVASELLKCPNGITIDKEGNYYIANFSDGNVIKVTAEGKATILLTIPGDNNGHIMFHSGYLYVVGRSVHSIYKVSLSGEMELFAGTGERGRTNGDRLKSTFNYPNDLDFSPDGKFLYVNEEADTIGNPRILTPTIVRRIRME